MARRLLGPTFIDDCSQQQAADFAALRIATREPAQIVTLNALMFNAVLADAKIKKAVADAALIVADSIGIQWAARILCGIRLSRITGIDFIYELSQRAKVNGWRVFLLGAKPGIAESAGMRLVSLFPGLIVVGTHHGYFTDHDAIIAHIKSVKPDVLFAGLSMPEQEMWIATNLLSMNVPVVVGVGGSFDVISGGLKRSPLWMRSTGLEWLFRLIIQPWRIGRIIQLPRFVYNVIKLKIKGQD